MKETINATIGSQAFTFDQDAYGTLRSYLNEIRIRLPKNDTETSDDIETRIAEIFREKIGNASMRVVTIETVHEAILQMGAPADFGERREGDSQADQGNRPIEPRKLFRSRTNCSIAGICGGIAAFFNISPTLLRLVTLLLILFGGLSIWIYIILWIVIPEEPLRQINFNTKNR